MLDVECRLPWLQMQFMMQKRFATFQSSVLAAITWLLLTLELHVPFRLNTFRKFHATNGRFQWHLMRQPTFSKPLGLMFAFGTIRILLWKTFIWLLSHLLVGTLAWPCSRCLRNCLTLSVLYGKTSWLVALRTGQQIWLGVFLELWHRSKTLWSQTSCECGVCCIK